MKVLGSIANWRLKPSHEAVQWVQLTGRAAVLACLACGSSRSHVSPDASDGGASDDLNHMDEIPGSQGAASGAGGGSAMGGTFGGVGGGPQSASGGSQEAAAGEGSGGQSSVGRVGVVGTACDTPGKLACAGNHQKVSVICDGAEWKPNETCKSGEFCDTSEGPDAGLCKPEVAACSNREPGALFCEDRTLHQCSADNVAIVTVETCDGPCEDGMCVPLEPGADACPSGNDWANCAGDCDGLGSSCDGGFWFSADRTIRLPSPSAAPECPDGRKYFRLELLSPEDFDGASLRFSGDGNWKISRRASYLTPDEACDSAAESCWQTPASNRNFWFISESSAGPPENITVEEVFSCGVLGCACE
jgi:hypothetical protein